MRTGGCGARLPVRPAEWAAPPSGARGSRRAAAALLGKQEILKLARTLLPPGLPESCRSSGRAQSRVGAWTSIFLQFARFSYMRV